MKVKNIINNNGNAARNQFVITSENGVYFQSYDSVIAFWERKSGRLIVTPLWDCSNTTRKHFYIFLNDYTGICGNRASVERGIANGHIIVVEDGKLDF